MRSTTTSNEIGLFSSSTNEEGTTANKMKETSVEARSKEGKEKTTLKELQVRTYNLIVFLYY